MTPVIGRLSVPLSSGSAPAVNLLRFHSLLNLLHALVLSAMTGEVTLTAQRIMVNTRLCAGMKEHRREQVGPISNGARPPDKAYVCRPLLFISRSTHVTHVRTGLGNYFVKVIRIIYL